MIRILTGTEDGVRRIFIDVNKPIQALDAMDRLLRTDMLEPKDYNYAELCDKGLENFKQDNPDSYPLKFKSKKRDEELWISGVSTGDREPGSRAVVQIMIFMGFKSVMNAERDVYSLAKGTKKVFEKRE